MNELSEENGKKLDRVIQLLEGDGKDAPGLIGRVGRMERELFGNGHMGITTRVQLMWRSWVWMLCTASAGAALAGREFIRIVFKV
jgi:hypothetical protein